MRHVRSTGRCQSPAHVQYHQRHQENPDPLRRRFAEMDMDERCSKCGEGCEKDSEQWNRCADLSDEEWLELLAGGMFFTDFFEIML